MKCHKHGSDCNETDPAIIRPIESECFLAQEVAGRDKRHTPQEKARIVLEFLNTNMSARIVPQARRLAGHVPRLKGQIHGGRETGLGWPGGCGYNDTQKSVCD